MWALSQTNNCEGGNYLFEDISRGAGSCSPGQLPVLTGLNNVKFRSSVRPGDTVETNCRLKRSKHPFYFAEATVTVEGRRCVTAEFSFALTAGA